MYKLRTCSIISWTTHDDDGWQSMLHTVLVDNESHKKMEEGKCTPGIGQRQIQNSRWRCLTAHSTLHEMNAPIQIVSSFVIHSWMHDVEHLCAAPMQHFSALHVVKCLFCTHINRVFLQQPRQHQQPAAALTSEEWARFSARCTFYSSRLLLLCFRLFWLRFCIELWSKNYTKQTSSLECEREMHARLSVAVTYVDGEINHKK